MGRLDDDAIAADLERALSAPGDRIAPAALVIARIEHPHLDARPHLEQLDEFGVEASRRLEGVETARARVNALNRYMFGALGFAADREPCLDPRNNFLNVVLKRRVGIPLTLSIVYIEIGRRAGLPLEGVAFPGHFLVRCAAGSPEAEATLIIDPFNGGKLLSQGDCLALLREHAGEEARWHASLLAPAGRRAIAARMLSNLKRSYVALRSFAQARKAADLLLALDPSAIAELRDRGLLSYHLDDLSAALRDLEKYLALIPKAESPGDDEEGGAREEGKAIWEHVRNLRRRVASFN